MYKRANTWLALFLFIFSTKRYLKLAVNHYIAINLEADDLRKKYEEGGYPDEAKIEKQARSSIYKLRSSLTKSLLAVLITLNCALLFGFILGKVNPFEWIKIMEIFAALLLMWSTLFELGWGLRTWKGQALHELVHSLLFKIIFLTGSLLLMASLVI